MIRKIVKIDKEKCTGCGACVDACHEGAIELLDGKAVLIKDDYCDGLGDCLPACPADAIIIEEREANDYNEEMVEKHKEEMKMGHHHGHGHSHHGEGHESQLSQWPVQIKLVPENAGFLDDADLLIATTCSGFAYGNIQNEFIKGRVTLVGCPKLDDIDYSDKLGEIIKNHNIKNIKLLKMEVPCCTGMEMMLKEAVKKSGKIIPWQVHIVSCDGKLIQ
jgi:NAD-dependent dihydropyrimidine dehydrogenase PreA subunit